VDLYPAIDLRGGRCVRLTEGDFDRETVYSDDPVEVARSFAGAGAPWVHVVDLDAARTGDPVNRSVISALTSLGVRIQAGGGVRSLADVSELLNGSVERVVIGTAAVENPSLVTAACREWPGRVAVGLDHRDGVVRVRGWTSEGGRRVADLVPAAVDAGVSAIIVTDISRDGTLAGPDVAGLAALLEATGAPIIASGGVRSLGDVEQLAALEGLLGVVVGRAIYEGKLDVASAVSCLAAGPSGAAGAAR
jgi:phosphoribosylformimino-5-aminoimidazole carboxamide ribotide isomerase